MLHRTYPVVFALLLAGFAALSATLPRAVAQAPAPQQAAATQSERPDYFDKPVTDDEFRLSMDEETARRADTLILQLADPVYKLRQEAQEALIQVGAAAMSKLREAYHAAEDLETKLRIEQVAHSAYVNHHVLDKHGFLGISMVAYDPSTYKPGSLYTLKNRRRDNTVDPPPRLPEGRVGVFVSQVIEPTGAARAGVRTGDVIIAMNGEPVVQQGGTIEDLFSARIRKHKPGATIELTVVRGRETLTLTPTLTRAPQGSLTRVRVLTDLYREASDRFDIWWEKFFLHPPGESDSQS